MAKVFDFTVVAPAKFYAGGEIDEKEYFEMTGQELDDASPEDAYDYLAARFELGFELDEIQGHPTIVSSDEYEA